MSVNGYQHSVIEYQGKRILVCNDHFCDYDGQSPTALCERYQKAEGDGSNPEDFSFCDFCGFVHRI